MPSNIILFGECGVGKSSIINLIAGHHQAGVSSSAKGCTLHATPYNVSVCGHSLTLWDTAGLNEGEKGTVTDIRAISNLYSLLKNLEGGVSLLVFCMRASRINGAAEKNWKFFREIVCQKRVPTVIIVTHLELEKGSMDDWWTRNERAFRTYEINPSTDNHPTGVACVTATKGKLKGNGYQFEEEYNLSQQKARDLITRAYLRVPWKVAPVEWFKTIVDRTTETDCWGNVTHVREERRRLPGRGVHELVSRCKISEAEATTLANALGGV
ncbi:hypothetical protein FA15DRAFT_648111 [Coprinopsis marcescibilis]|uniref:G domain-containing protein n=1 Tax=Coprinopsis marcescibilis TaxID=230819 RepID=A0A5C3KHU7_COPMA|nr:hypothetical protein FA15DRAFT_648111 [Coprinopsis marcescibilis]